MFAGVRKNIETPALAAEPVKKTGSGTAVRSSFNGRYIPAGEVKRHPREPETGPAKPTRKTK